MRFLALVSVVAAAAFGYVAVASTGSTATPAPPVGVGVDIGGRPSQTVVGAGSVWVLTCDVGCMRRTLVQRAALSRGRLVRVSIRSGRVLSVTAIADPGAVAVGDGAVWVTHPDRGAVSRIDLDSGRLVATVGLMLPSPIIPGDRAFLPEGVAVGGRGVWVSTARGWVARIDPRSDRVVALIALPFESTAGVVAGAGGVWVAEGLDGVYRIDPQSDSVLTKTPITGPAGSRLAVDQVLVEAGSVWAEGDWATPTASGYVSTDRGGLARLTTRDQRTRVMAAIAPGPSGISTGHGAIWVASRTRAIVQRLDARSGHLVETIGVPGPGMQVAYSAGFLWLISDAGVLTRVRVRSHRTARSSPATHIPATAIRTHTRIVGMPSGRALARIGMHERAGAIRLLRVTAPVRTRLTVSATIPGIASVQIATPRQANDPSESCQRRGRLDACTQAVEACPMPAATWHLTMHKLAGPAIKATIQFVVG